MSFERAERVNLPTAGSPEPAEDVAVVTIDPNVPMRIDARSQRNMHVIGTNPNATFEQLLGPRTEEGMKRVTQLRQALLTEWPRYIDAIHYYLNEQWHHFERAIDDIITVSWTDSNMRGNQRHRMALYVSQLVLLPAQPDKHSLRLTNDYARFGSPAFANEHLRAYAAELSRTGELSTVRADLYRILLEFMGAWEDWQPGLVVRMVQPSLEHELSSLRVARDGFPRLRDIYLQACETICRAFPLLAAIVNTAARGTPNAFGEPPARLVADNAKEQRPASLQRYSESNCARKLAYAAEWPAWQILLPQLIDLKFRNEIGHASVRHNLQTGNIETKSGLLSYPRFLGKVFDLSYPIIAALQWVKSISLLAGEVEAELQS